MIDKGGDCYANFFMQITYFVIYMRISACRDVVLIPCGNIQAICKGNLILKMEVKSKEGMGKQIMHKDFMFVFLQNLESRVAASREAHKEKSCQLAS